MNRKQRLGSSRDAATIFVPAWSKSGSHSQSCREHYRLKASGGQELLHEELLGGCRKSHMLFQESRFDGAGSLSAPTIFSELVLAKFAGNTLRFLNARLTAEGTIIPSAPNPNAARPKACVRDSRFSTFSPRQSQFTRAAFVTRMRLRRPASVRSTTTSSTESIATSVSGSRFAGSNPKCFGIPNASAMAPSMRCAR